MQDKIILDSVDCAGFVDMVTDLMVTGKLGDERSDFTIIYGDFIPEWIDMVKNRIERKIEKIPDHSVGRVSNFYSSYFWVKRPDGSTGCIKMYGRGRIKGVRWEDKRPEMAIIALKTGVSKYIDTEIYASILPSLTPQNPTWIEMEIADAP